MTRPVLTLAAALSMSLLAAACSKPAAETTADAANDTGAAMASAPAATAAATDAAADGAMAPGGAVSPPAANAAVDTNASADGAPAAAANSFTEDQARGHITNAGYTDVTGLTKTADGMWMAKAKKGGKAMDVSLDFKGAVTAK
ncbi:hypothetical protein [Phenylobacterium sp.]|uniref:hypothetical protein n=1 Tax=Phenylobacterium sp. TaxID=1871053 RepID=UPI00273587CA|nr:hypothetical protein [Phenylobacterium sp.]MDP3658682.1 hypothetical protein [Phenylobacterium sp.]